MRKEQLKNNLLAVARTLGEIEIKGKDNMNKLLGCIQHLESLAEEVMKDKEGEDDVDL